MSFKALIFTSHGDLQGVSRKYRKNKMTQQLKLLRISEVISIVHYSKPSIYRLISEGKFPKPIKLGGRSVFWVDSEVSKFVQNCIDNSKEKTI